MMGWFVNSAAALRNVPRNSVFHDTVVMIKMYKPDVSPPQFPIVRLLWFLFTTHKSFAFY